MRRALSGLAAGLAITTVPPLLHLISQTSSIKLVKKHTGSIGILNQFAIVIGICTAQLIGLAMTGLKGDAPGGWRWVTLGSGVVAVAQILGGFSISSDVMPSRSAAGESEDRRDDLDSPDQGERRGHVRSSSAADLPSLQRFHYCAIPRNHANHLKKRSPSRSFSVRHRSDPPHCLSLSFSLFSSWPVSMRCCSTRRRCSKACCLDKLD